MTYDYLAVGIPLIIFASSREYFVGSRYIILDKFNLLSSFYLIIGALIIIITSAMSTQELTSIANIVKCY